MKIRKNNRRDEPDTKNKQSIFHITQFKIDQRISTKTFLYLLLREKMHRKSLFSTVNLEALNLKAGISVVSQKNRKILHFFNYYLLILLFVIFQVKIKGFERYFKSHVYDINFLNTNHHSSSPVRLLRCCS